jgi:hypothetical protein
MNILLLDEHDDVIENPVLLESIFEELTNKPIIKHVSWEGSILKMILPWKRVHLEKSKSRFMGSLFITSAYSDTALFDVMKAILDDIEQKFSNDSWKISFHISKILEINERRRIRVL